MLKVKTAVNLEEVNKYCATRVKNMGVAVGTFGEQNARKVAMKEPANDNPIMHGKSKAYGTYVKSLKTQDTVTNAEVAYCNIYGHKKTPKRNYFTLAFSSKFMEAKKFSFLRNLYKKQAPILDTYRRLGNLGQASVKRAILEYKTPPNSAKTIKAKGFNKPLIWTMQLLRSIRWHPLSGMLEYMNRETGEVREV